MGAIAGAALVPGCTARADDNTAETAGADLTLNPQQCATPTTGTSPRLDPTGAPVPGTARTTVNGCFLMDGGPFLQQAFDFISNPAHLSSIIDDQAKPFFSSIRAVPTTQGTNFTQDMDVTLAWDSQPAGRLRVTLIQQPPNLMVSIVNTTPLINTADGTVIANGGLTLNARLTAQSNGISMVGTAEVTLQAEQQRATTTSMFVRHVFEWLSSRFNVAAPSH
jgi:hypothetical protein